LIKSGFQLIDCKVSFQNVLIDNCTYDTSSKDIYIFEFAESKISIQNMTYLFGDCYLGVLDDVEIEIEKLTIENITVKILIHPFMLDSISSNVSFKELVLRNIDSRKIDFV